MKITKATIESLNTYGNILEPACNAEIEAIVNILQNSGILKYKRRRYVLEEGNTLTKSLFVCNVDGKEIIYGHTCVLAPERVISKLAEKYPKWLDYTPSQNSRPAVRFFDVNELVKAILDDQIG